MGDFIEIDPAGDWADAPATEVSFRWCGECEAVTGVRYPGGDWTELGKRHGEWHKKLEARFAAIEQAGLRASVGPRGLHLDG
jgi:hypothetical protein